MKRWNLFFTEYMIVLFVQSVLNFSLWTGGGERGESRGRVKEEDGTGFIAIQGIV